MKAIVPLFLLTLPTAHAANFSEVCKDIADCAQTISEITGDKYVFDKNVRGRIDATKNVELTKENATLLYTQALQLNGFTRVPLGQKNTYTIKRVRAARDQNIPIFKTQNGKLPTLPQNYDLITIIYKMENAVLTDDLARMLRSFMPANSRVIPSETSGILTITDTAMNITKLHEIIKEHDVKPSKEALKKLKSKQNAHAQRRARQKGN